MDVFILSSLLVILTFGFVRSAEYCPPKCECYFKYQGVGKPDVFWTFCTKKSIEKLERFAFDPKTESLHISGHNFPRLTDSSFSPVIVNLSVLFLDNNKIETIENLAFAPIVGHIHSLGLRSNRLSEIPTAALQQTPSLSYISFLGNLISIVRTRAFESLKKLQDIDLAYNRITTIERNAFAGLSNLEKIRFYNNQITTINNEAFVGLIRLKTLDLHYNNLSEVPSAALRHTPGLNSIVLEENRCSTVKNQAFKSLQQLETLYIGGNALTTIEPEAFTGLSKLKNFALARNRLVQAPPNVFKELAQQKTIENLYLMDNPWACECFLKWLIQLYLNKLTQSIPHCIYNGKYFQWNDEQVQNVTQMCCPKKCRCVFQTKTIDCSGLGFDYEDATRLNIDEETSELSLANNRLKKVDPILWKNRNLVQLHFLDLSGNQITIIETESFVDLKKLERLNLSNNKLITVEPMAFKGLDELRELNLMDNRLEQLPGNFIKNLSDNLVANDKSSLLLANNPWLCNCNLADPIEFLNSFPPTNGRWPTCQQPQQVKGIDWTSKELVTQMTDCINYNCPADCACMFSHAKEIRFPIRELTINCSYQRIIKVEGFGDPITFNLTLKKTFLASLDKTSFNQEMVNLVELDVSFCYIKTIAEDAFKPFSGSLKRLDLTNNQLSEVPTAAIRQTTSLVELSLLRNRISTIPSRAFETLNKLEFLDLGHNQIYIVRPDAFKGLLRLRKLSMCKNHLIGIPLNLFDKLFRHNIVTELYLDENPWQCGCYLKRAYDKISGNLEISRNYMPQG